MLVLLLLLFFVLADEFEINLTFGLPSMAFNCVKVRTFIYTTSSFMDKRISLTHSVQIFVFVFFFAFIHVFCVGILCTFSHFYVCHYITWHFFTDVGANTSLHICFKNNLLYSHATKNCKWMTSHLKSNIVEGFEKKVT